MYGMRMVIHGLRICPISVISSVSSFRQTISNSTFNPDVLAALHHYIDGMAKRFRSNLKYPFTSNCPGTTELPLFSSWGFIYCSDSMDRRSGGEQEAAWTAGFQRKYIRQLVAVLRHGRIERTTRGLARSRAVKLAADMSLAMAARGRTAWSRAILRKYLFRPKKSRCQRRSVIKSGWASANNSKRCKTTFPGKKSVRRLFRVTVASRMQSLMELIPGSRHLDTLFFLEEVTDYIVALKMQVEAMQALTGWYAD